MKDAKASDKDRKDSAKEIGNDKDAEEGGAEGAAPARKRLSGRTLVLFMILPIFLVVSAGAAAHFMGLTKSLFGSDHVDDKAPPVRQATFYNLPEMLVNLNTTGRRASFLKISVSLELESPTDVPKIEAAMPRIVDNFQSYLRELRVEDLRGSSGLFRLREELLTRVSAAAQPAKINDVLFKEMLVQ